MKKIVLILVLGGLFSVRVTAQEYVRNNVQSPFFSYEKWADDNYSFHFQTSILDYYVPVFTHTTYIDGDTLYVRLTCDITTEVVYFGTPLIYNQSVLYPQVIPSNVQYIALVIDVLMLADQPPRDPILVQNVYSHLIDLNLGTQQNSVPSVIVYPNPMRDVFYTSDDFDFNSLNISNTLGQEVMVLPKNASRSYDVRNLPSGVYSVQFFTEENQKIKALKVIKQN